MTNEAKQVISAILLVAQTRLLGTTGPFWYISEMLGEYYREWYWIR